MDNELKELLTRIAVAMENSVGISKMHLEQNRMIDKRNAAFYNHMASDRTKKYDATENRYVDMSEEEIVAMFWANERVKDICKKALDSSGKSE
jgi:hypothetical protein